MSLFRSKRDEKAEDAIFEQLLSRIPPKFFNRSNFNPFEYYENEKELDRVQETVNNAVDIVVNKCYRAFNNATTSFRSVLQTFSESQAAVRRLQADVQQGQRVLFTNNHNLHDLYHQQLIHSHILDILGRIEIVSDLPKRVAGYLARHQYLRASVLLLHGLKLLTTPELRQISALHNIREELLMLKQDLQRALDEELKNMVFLNHPRLRQSVLDDSVLRSVQAQDTMSPNHELSTILHLLRDTHSGMGSGSGNGSFIGHPSYTKSHPHPTPHKATSPSILFLAKQSLFRFYGSAAYKTLRYPYGYGYFTAPIPLYISQYISQLQLQRALIPEISLPKPTQTPRTTETAHATKQQHNGAKKSRNALTQHENIVEHTDTQAVSMEYCKSSLFPSFMDVFTPAAVREIVASSPVAMNDGGSIMPTTITKTLAPYLSLHGYQPGGLLPEALREDDPIIIPFLLICQDAIEADALDPWSRSHNAIGADQPIQPAILGGDGTSSAASSSSFKGDDSTMLSNTPSSSGRLLERDRTASKTPREQQLHLTSHDQLSLLNRAKFTGGDPLASPSVKGRSLNGNSGTGQSTGSNNSSTSSNSSSGALRPHGVGLRLDAEAAENTSIPGPLSSSSSSSSNSGRFAGSPNSPTSSSSSAEAMSGPRAADPPAKELPKHAGSVFHARYLYRLMAIESVPAYTADPVAYPREYMTILVEALNQLNYLPSVEQRLQKSTTESINQLIQREVNALTTQVLDYAVARYQQSTALASGTATITADSPTSRKSAIATASGKRKSSRNTSITSDNDGQDSQAILTAILTYQVEHTAKMNQKSHRSSSRLDARDASDSDHSSLRRAGRKARDNGSTDDISQSSGGDEGGQLAFRRRQRRAAQGLSPTDSSLGRDESSLSRDRSNLRHGGGKPRNGRFLTRNRSLLDADGIGGDEFNDDDDDDLFQTSSTRTASTLADKYNIDLTTLQQVLSLLEHDRDFQGLILTDLLSVLFKLCIRVLLTQKEVMMHIIGTKYFHDKQLTAEMTLPQYNNLVTAKFTNPSILVQVHEYLKSSYNAMQMHIQTILWRFFEKDRPPPVFSFDDRHSFLTSGVNSYKVAQNITNANSHTSNDSLSFFSRMFRSNPTPVAPPVVKGNTTTTTAAALATQSSALAIPTNVDFSFNQSRRFSIVKQNAILQNAPMAGATSLDSLPEGSSGGGMRNRRRQRHKQRTDDDLGWGGDDDDYGALSTPLSGGGAGFLSKTSSGSIHGLQVDQIWVLSSSYHIPMVYMPILHFADYCNILVDGVPNTPYLPPPPMFSLFPTLLEWPQHYPQTPPPSLPVTPTARTDRGGNHPSGLGLALQKHQSQTRGAATSPTDSTSPLSTSPQSSGGNDLPEYYPGYTGYLLPVVDLTSAFDALEAREAKRKAYIKQRNKAVLQASSSSSSVLSFGNIQDILTSTSADSQLLMNPLAEYVNTPCYSQMNAASSSTGRSIPTSAMTANGKPSREFAVAISTRGVPQVNTSFFKPYLFPSSIPSLLSTPRLRITMDHASYPLAQCLSLAISEVFIPRLHTDVMQVVERILNDVNAFKPYEHITSHSLADKNQQYHFNVDFTFGQQNQAAQASTSPGGGDRASSQSSSGERASTGNTTSRPGSGQTAPPASRTSFFSRRFFKNSGETTTYRSNIYQQCIQHGVTPFHNLYTYLYALQPNYASLSTKTLENHIFGNAAQSVIGGHDGVIPLTGTATTTLGTPGNASGQTSATSSSKAAGLTTSEPRSIILIRCAYQLSQLLEALAADLCLLPQTISAAIPLLCHVINCFIEKVKKKYSEITHLHDGTVYSATALQKPLALSAMGNDIWFLDFRGVPRTAYYQRLNRKASMHNLFSQSQLSLPNNTTTLHSQDGQPSFIKSPTLLFQQDLAAQQSLAKLGDKPGGRQASDSSSASITAVASTTTGGGSGGNSKQLNETPMITSNDTDLYAEMLIELFYSHRNPLLAKMFQAEFSLGNNQLLHQLPVDLTTNVRSTDLSQAAKLAVMSMRQGWGANGDGKSPQEDTSRDSLYLSETLNITSNASDNQSTQSAAMKPFSYLALLSTSLDWLSNFLYHLPLPHLPPTTLESVSSSISSQTPSSSSTVTIYNASISNSPSQGLAGATKSMLDRVTALPFTQRFFSPSPADTNRPGAGSGAAGSSASGSGGGAAMGAAGQTSPHSHKLQPVSLVPGSLHNGAYIPLLLPVVPSCYSSSSHSSHAAIASISMSLDSYSSQTPDNVSQLTTAAATLQGTGVNGALPFGGLQDSSSQVESSLQSVATLVDSFISPSLSAIFGHEERSSMDSLLTSGMPPAMSTSNILGQTNPSTSLTTATSSLPGALSSSATAITSSSSGGYAAAKSSTLSPADSTNSYITALLNSPLLMPSEDNVAALSRTLALSKLLPDAYQARMYVVEEASVRWFHQLTNPSTPTAANGRVGASSTTTAASGSRADSTSQFPRSSSLLGGGPISNPLFSGSWYVNNPSGVGPTEDLTASGYIQTLLQQDDDASESNTTTPTTLTSVITDISLVRHKLSLNLYNLSNLCLFTVKFELMCRVFFHLKFSVMSNYDIRPKSKIIARLRQLQQHQQYQQQSPSGMSPTSSPTASIAGESPQNGLTRTASIAHHNVETQQFILDLNRDFILAEEALSRFWDDSRIHYVFGGLSLLISSLLIYNFQHLQIKRVSHLGIRAILRNIFAIQQNLVNITPLPPSLMLLSRFPEFHHHTIIHQDQHFIRVKTYVELMRYTPTELLAFQKNEPKLFTRHEYKIVFDIVRNNAEQRIADRKLRAKLRSAVRQKMSTHSDDDGSGRNPGNARYLYSSTDSPLSTTTERNSSGGDTTKSRSPKEGGRTNLRRGQGVREQGRVHIQSRHKNYGRNGNDDNYDDDDDDEYERVPSKDYFY